MEWNFKHHFLASWTWHKIHSFLRELHKPCKCVFFHVDIFVLPFSATTTRNDQIWSTVEDVAVYDAKRLLFFANVLIYSCQLSAARVSSHFPFWTTWNNCFMSQILWTCVLEWRHRRRCLCVRSLLFHRGRPTNVSKWYLHMQSVQKSLLLFIKYADLWRPRCCSRCAELSTERLGNRPTDDCR